MNWVNAISITQKRALLLVIKLIGKRGSGYSDYKINNQNIKKTNKDNNKNNNNRTKQNENKKQKQKTEQIKKMLSLT